jgi:hypothetical protein
VAAPGQDEGARAALESALGHGNARLLQWACTRIPLTPDVVDGQGMIADPQLHLALTDMLHAFGRFLATPQARSKPSWDAYSSVYPVVLRKNPSAASTWRAKT